MWKKALRVDYMPVAHVMIVRKDPKKSKSANVSAVAELCKYPMKDTDLSLVGDFELLTKELKGVRNINAGGIFKGILSKEKKIDEDLVHIEDENREELWRLIEKICYQFENKNGKLNYYRKENE